MPASSRRVVFPSREGRGAQHPEIKWGLCKLGKPLGERRLRLASEAAGITSTHPPCGSSSRVERLPLRDLLPEYHGGRCACGHPIDAHSIGAGGTVCRSLVRVAGDVHACLCPLFIPSREVLR